MTLYHRTRAAAAVLAGGFEDHTGYYLTDSRRRRVWFADRRKLVIVRPRCA
jgi:hypothetical protein